jgi:hypothetical protein
MDSLDRDAPLYEAVLPVRLAGGAAPAGGGAPDRVVAATVRLLRGSRAAGGRRTPLLYLEVVDDGALTPWTHGHGDAGNVAAVPPHSSSTPSTSSAAAAASEGLLHHSVTLGQDDYPALAVDQALNVPWDALPGMLTQLLEAARTGASGAVDGDGGLLLPSAAGFATPLLGATPLRPHGGYAGAAGAAVADTAALPTPRSARDGLGGGAGSVVSTALGLQPR